MAQNHEVVLIRHGKSLWNIENRFTGWADCELSAVGKAEAAAAGELLKQHGFCFDLAYTSCLSRAVSTTKLVLQAMDLSSIPIIRAWQLNERHYGELQGMTYASAVIKHGQEQVRSWRKELNSRPPKMDFSDPRHPSREKMYRAVPIDRLPSAESLQDAITRLLPYWNDEIAPSIQEGRRVLISAHGNILRGLIWQLEALTMQELLDLYIPTAVPIVWMLDEQLNPISRQTLML
jgi:2,3-bisphosphoglycerate-dependent phosphoglycerate mutase